MWRNEAGKGRPLYNETAVVTFGVGGDGAPDLMGYLIGSGRAFYLEVKTPKGRKRDDQLRWHAVHSRQGPFVAFVRSVEEALAALGRAEQGDAS